MGALGSREHECSRFGRAKTDDTSSQMTYNVALILSSSARSGTGFACPATAMRLLDTFTFELREFYDQDIPEYAILSHRWEAEEVSFRELQDGSGKRLRGWSKIERCCATAHSDGFKYVWIDTCCIDKSSSAELSEAINSMFRWYQESRICYAYLSDVSTKDKDSDAVKRAFAASKWFTRGWTLQELLAPCEVVFFDCEWIPIGTSASRAKKRGPSESATVVHTKGRRVANSHRKSRSLSDRLLADRLLADRLPADSRRKNGSLADSRRKYRSLSDRLLVDSRRKNRSLSDRLPADKLLAESRHNNGSLPDSRRKDSLLKDILAVTGISRLDFFNPKEASVAKRISWASKRETTRQEDMAYCLMGLFDVNMPLLYGEGKKAFLRLQLQILQQSDDESIFAWTQQRGASGLLAGSPADFANSSNITLLEYTPRTPFSMTNKGLRIDLEVYDLPVPRVQGISPERHEKIDRFWAAPLNCTRGGRIPIVIYLMDVGEHYRAHTLEEPPQQYPSYVKNRHEFYVRQDIGMFWNGKRPFGPCLIWDKEGWGAV